MENVPTHALIADTFIGSFSLEKGAKEDMLKAHKRWWTKIFNGKQKKITVEVPNNLLASFTPTMFLGLRVAEIPPQLRNMDKMMNDPRYQAFLQNAQGYDQQMTNQMDGVDLLDQGIK